ncbi:fluoride efflux transporter FluC [Candidatus Planktophila dulcis]|jgi:CrcB protein|uniref:fluoride efflux transporter FluC n=1 Tax=Candidatus Planktophila dulcis TaxID=1884914 RepID=UPI003CEA88CD|nr:CrcB family protein [Actinomycetota bacterium]
MRLLPFIAGAALGAPLRYLIDKFFRTKYVFPVGILIVNVVGSFILGYTQDNYFVMGFCGAFTTWSAFMLDVDRELPFRRRTAINIALTFGLSIAAIAAGFALAS